jgi:hypothetical protein
VLILWNFARQGNCDEDEWTIPTSLGTASQLDNNAIKLDADLLKWTPVRTHDRGWQERRIVLTTHDIVFLKFGMSSILDVIPLRDVTSIHMGSHWCESEICVKLLI